MSTDIKSVTSNQEVHEAADLMSKYQIRRLPVVEQGKLLGIVAIGDLAIKRSTLMRREMHSAVFTRTRSPLN